MSQTLTGCGLWFLTSIGRYPTEDRSGPASPYVPMLSSYRRLWEDSDVDLASRTLTHFRLDAKPMSSVQFPVVLLSHGRLHVKSVPQIGGAQS